MSLVKYDHKGTLYCKNSIQSTTDDLILSSVTGKIKVENGQSLDVGTNSNISATKLRNISVSTNQPLVGQFLGFDGSMWKAMQTPATSFSHQITVAKSGGSYTTITEALQAAVALNPSQDNPVVIRIYSGTYIENNTPLVIPSYVSITGISKETVIIKPSNSSTTMFDMRHQTVIRDVTIRDASLAVDVKQQGTISSIIYNCYIFNCTVGVHVASGNALTCTLVNFKTYDGFIMTEAVFNEGSISLNNIDIVPIIGDIETGILHQGSLCTITDTAIVGCSVAAIHVYNSSDPNASLFMSTVFITDSFLGLNVEIGLVIATSSLFINNVTDIVVSDFGAFAYSTVMFDMSRSSISENALFYGNGISDELNERRNRLVGNVIIGEIGQYSTLAIGQGSSYKKGMIVQSNSNGVIGTWIDHTANASNPSGDSYAAFPNASTNASIYFGGDSQFVALTVVTMTKYLGGNIVFEYWNGSTWQSLSILVIDQDSHINYYSDAFGRDIAIENIRFSSIITQSWQMTQLNGRTKYWIRARIASDLTIIPILGNVRLRTSSTFVGNDGFTEYFGAAQPTKELTLHQNLLYDVSGDVAVSTDVSLSINLTLLGKNNKFNSGVNHGVIFSINIPTNINVTENLKLRFGYYRNDTASTIGSPALRFKLTYRLITQEDILDGTLTDDSSTIDVDPIPTLKQLKFLTFNVPISNAKADDILFMKLERLGAQDAYQGNIVIPHISCSGKAWCA